MIHQDIDKEGNSTGTEIIIIPACNLYNREAGDGKGKDRVTIFAYEIKYTPKNAYVLKNLLYTISMEYSKFKFILNGINYVTTPTTMRQIIINQNEFL